MESWEHEVNPPYIRLQGYAKAGEVLNADLHGMNQKQGIYQHFASQIL